MKFGEGKVKSAIVTQLEAILNGATPPKRRSVVFLRTSTLSVFAVETIRKTLAPKLPLGRI